MSVAEGPLGPGTGDSGKGDGLRAYRLLAVLSLGVIVASVPAYLLRERLARRVGVTSGAAVFVGRSKCATCHERETTAWTGSDHANAMAEATPKTVLANFDDQAFVAHGIESRFFKRDGKFFVRTEGPGGVMGDFEVAYTFGVRPLQQYLVRFPGGRLQALHLAWDVPGKRWFHLYPNERIVPSDWMHWTRNAMNWNGMCAACHSTNLVKGYDAGTQSYKTTWSEINVSCEACHGPGSKHVAWAELPPMARLVGADNGLVVRTRGSNARVQVEQCAPCHSRRSELAEDPHVGGDMLDSYVPSLLSENLYFPDGQIQDEVYEYGSFLQSKMYARGVKCGDCHDVHGLKRYDETNALCTRCHRADVYDSETHHFHKKVVDGKPSGAARCIACHVPRRIYMGVDPRADHSLRVPRPDLTASLGVPNACSQKGCHDDKPLRYVLDAQRRWYGEARKPHYGTVLAAGRDAKPEARDPLVRLAGDPLYPTIVRATALSLLSRFPSPETDEAFKRAVNDPESLLRHTAAAAFPPLSDQEAVERLAPLLADPTRAVRLEAVTRLVGLPESLFKPYQRERLQVDIREYLEAMQRNLDFAFAGHNLGNLYSRLGRADLAEKNYRIGLGIDDLFFPAKVNLAVLLSGQGRTAEAETLLRSVLEASPQMHDVSYSLGLLLAEEKKFDEAARHMRSAAEGLPRVSRARYNLGLLEETLGHVGEAEAALREAVALEPENADYLHALAYHYLTHAAPAQAAPLVARLAALRPGSEAARDMQRLLAQAQRSGQARPRGRSADPKVRR